VIWQHVRPDGTVENVRPPALSYRVLMVKARINQSSVALLLDTGASDNYMSVRLVKSLGLLVRPDHQGIKVILADGHQAQVTGTVTVPVCIGRFRAKIEFLPIIDLDASFDAILGYTWLRRNCDLHLSKRMVAFRTGSSQVVCYKLPPPQKATVPTGRWSHSGLGSTLANSQRAEWAGASHRPVSLTPEGAVLPPVVPGQ
jgi:hypothetical protein